jgi:chemotaxis protein CheC
MGAAHAATALSQMTGGTIMIAVPRLHVAPLAEVAPELAPGEQPVAAVMMDMLGDLTGRTLLVFPKPTVLRLAELMLRRPMGSSVALGELEQSAVQEIGNILSGAYLNALSDFMGMVLLPSPRRSPSAASTGSSRPSSCGSRSPTARCSSSRRSS